MKTEPTFRYAAVDKFFKRYYRDGEWIDKGIQFSTSLDEDQTQFVETDGGGYSFAIWWTDHEGNKRCWRCSASS